MPKINFCFSGWINDANITTCANADGNQVDVSQMTPDELIQKLNSGELFLSLKESLNNSDSEEIEIFDFSKPI